MQLRRHNQDIQAAGGEVLVISFEPEERLAQLSRQLQLSFALISDQERNIYRAYGLTRGSWRRVFGLKTIWAYINLVLRGRRYHFVRSDLRQLGGDFVIDQEGIIRFGYLSTQPQDRPGVEELLEVVKEI